MVVDHAIGFIRRHWRFRPFIVQGKPAAVTFVVPISFTLDNGRLRKRSDRPPSTDIMSSFFSKE
jgi:hypothetical protein